MRGFKSFISTFILCFCFWMLLTWSIAPKELIMGAIASSIIAWFAGKFFIHTNPFYLFNPVRLVLIVIYYGFVFLWELIKSNVSMAALVLSPNLKNYQAGTIRIPGGKNVKSEYGLAAVSNCITLTPGTITMDVAEDENGDNYYYIHWINVTEMDREKAADVIKGTIEKWVGRIWK